MKRLHVREVPDEEKPAMAVRWLDYYRKDRRSLTLAMEGCVKCGVCAEQCHAYLGTKDPNNIPAARADLMRRVYKRYFTVQGRLFGKLVGAVEMTMDVLEKWYSYYYQCSECRRCGHVCPFGIDTCEVTMAGREILWALGFVPELQGAASAMVFERGNQGGMTQAAIVDTHEFLTDEMEEERGFRIEFPVDKPNSDILYVPSSADYLLNAETLKGAAQFFEYVGANWTISSYMLEAGNFGLLTDQRSVQRELVRRLWWSVADLGIKKVVFGECGHGWRAWKMYTETLTDYAVAGPGYTYTKVPLVNIHQEVVALLKAGKLKLDPKNNRLAPVGTYVTLHDPCNYVRADQLGDVFRYVLYNSVPAVREMYPIKEKNFCCGGGSAILYDDPEMYNLRIKFFQKKADQVRASGANHICTPCSICKAQFYPMVKEHNLTTEDGKTIMPVNGLIDFLGAALVFKGHRQI
ncbi:MAG TPA: (Fe-S)-binding protein [Desulfotomaculum sp.]|nr:(Fe-S)-binding protein [Desulfotomaculum sp.]